MPHFQEVSEIADTATETFLIGGEKKVQALQVTTKDNGTLIHQQRTLFPGDVLRKGKIYVGEKKRKSKYLRKTKLVTEKYLMCTDDSDREILLPFDQKGLFYTLTTNSGNVLRPVMQMSQIVAKKYPPCIVRLVYGRIPNTPCFFSGTLRLDRADLEQSVIASTIINKRNILLEIPTSCDLKFKVAVTNEALIQNSGYKASLELCNEKATIYMRHMKVCHTIEPDSHVVRENEEIEKPDVVDEKALFVRISNTTLSSSTDDELSSTNDRGSDYFEMRSVKGASHCEEIVKDLTDTDTNESPCSSPDYTKMKKPPEQSFIKIVVENSFMTVPVTDITANQRHETEPPLVPPPPPPLDSRRYSQTFNENESSDSGIITDAEISRRPSTITFSESKYLYEDNPTYDIPRRTRRDSAPAELSGPHVHVNVKQEFLRRPSSVAPIPQKYSTLPSRMRERMSETLHEHTEHEAEDDRSHDVDDTSRDSDVRMKADDMTLGAEGVPLFAVDSLLDDKDMIPEYNSDEEYGAPVYENIIGMVKIHDDLLEHQKKSFEANGRQLPDLPERRPRAVSVNTERSSARDSGNMSPKRSQEVLCSNKLNSSIGPIPNLPRSRNSPRDSSNGIEFDEILINEHMTLTVPFEIPALPSPRTNTPSPRPEIRRYEYGEEDGELSDGSMEQSHDQEDDENENDLVAESNVIGIKCCASTETIEKSDSLNNNESGEVSEKVRAKSDTFDEQFSQSSLVRRLEYLPSDVTEDRDINSNSQAIPSFDDIVRSETEFGCILTENNTGNRVVHDRHSLYSDKSFAASSLDSGIVSRDPSVFGSKSSDIHLRNSLEIESYEKGTSFSVSEDLESPSDNSQFEQHNFSFSSENSESGSVELASSFHDTSFESDETKNFPGKEIHHDQPFVRNKPIRCSRSRDSKDISKMNVEDLATEFRRIGIKAETIQAMRQEKLTGYRLLEKYATLENIREMFPNAGLIEQQKISLFIQGCKY